jgi:alpha-glucuronidase
MTLDGYRIAKPSSPPYQLNQSAIVTTSNSTSGSATATIPYPAGIYDVVVDYYDLYKGISTWDLFINKQKLGSWRGNAENVLGHELTYYLDGNSESRIRFANVTVAEGDTVRIVGHPDGLEPAPVNYIAFIPKGMVVED